jgi:3-mercaptopyruvate sulfurtransferase SseA
VVGALDVDYLMYVSMRPYGSINTDETFKSIDELQAFYSNKGITPDKQIFP